MLMRGQIARGFANFGLAALLLCGLGGSNSVSPNTDFETIKSGIDALSLLASAPGHVCPPNGCGPNDFDATGFSLGSEKTDDDKLILLFNTAGKPNRIGFYLDTLQVSSSLFSPSTVTINAWTFRTTPDQAKQVVDALTTVKSFGGLAWRHNKIIGELYFAVIARAYRSLPVKPVPGEDVHRYQVQAADALQNKQLDDADALYNRALTSAPWWPEGEFNLELIQGELGKIHHAIVHMKRYLALVPDAPNARQVQDKIYVWERTDKTAEDDPAADRSWLDSLYRSPECKLCVQDADVPLVVATAHHLPDTKGAVIIFVAKDSVAEAAGLLPEDIVLSVAGNPITGAADLNKAVSRFQVASVAPIEIVRDDKRMTLNLKF